MRAMSPMSRGLTRRTCRHGAGSVLFTNTTIAYSTLTQMWWMCRPYILGPESRLIHSTRWLGLCEASISSGTRRSPV